MKTITFTFLVLLATASAALAQGTFQYDQQSLNHTISPDVLVYIQSNEPVGQSFIPSLSAVGFVQLELFDGHPNNGLGASLYVNIRSNSIVGSILGSSDSVFLPDTPFGGGLANFFFSGPAAVVPGTTCVFEIVVQSGNLWSANTVPNLYSGGTAFLQGVSQPLEDLWFREGVIVPEPSARWLILLIGGLWLYVRRMSVRSRVFSNPPFQQR